MLFKLIALVVMAHHINACCLPPSYQFTVLSETHVGEHRFRAQIILAADAAAGKAGIFSFSQQGQHLVYADFHNRSLYNYAPGYGCQASPINDDFLRQLNESRCAPTHLLTETPYPLTLAGSVNVTLYSGRVPFGGDNSTVDVDAVISDRCLPVFFKLSGRHFNSINLVGNFRAAPEPGLLDLPAECRRNASLSGPRKRELVKLGFGFGANPFMI